MATLIKDKFLRPNLYRQIFILTHHLYFLHEFIGWLKNKNNWALFRVSKFKNGTAINAMQIDEIKNNYEGYWQILKDIKADKVNKIVLPNVMRNILEQYFSFIHMQDKLTVALAKLSAENKGNLSYKSFDRYMNRESHSDAINFIDVNEVEPNKYFKYFEAVFIETGFLEHYNVMMGAQESVQSHAVATGG